MSGSIKPVRKRELPETLREIADRHPGAEYRGDVLKAAADRIEALERKDRQAAEYVESVICMRTNFTGDPPYVGWRGSGSLSTRRLTSGTGCGRLRLTGENGGQR